MPFIKTITYRMSVERTFKDTIILEVKIPDIDQPLEERQLQAGKLAIQEAKTYQVTDFTMEKIEATIVERV